MTDSSSPNATPSMLFFVIITTIFFMIKYYTKDPKQNIIWTVVYILILVVSQLIINLKISEQICGTQQWGTAYTVTLVPWIVVFGMLQVMLMMFPGWKTPFANTFGYGLSKLTGINDTLNNILLPKLSKKDGNSKSNEALEHIYADKSLLLNEITEDNFDGFWNNMSSANLFKGDASNYKSTLYDFVKFKYLVSEYIWFILAGALVISMSFNYMVSSSCKKSVDDMIEINDKFNDEQKSNKYKDPKTRKIYTSYE